MAISGSSSNGIRLAIGNFSLSSGPRGPALAKNRAWAVPISRTTISADISRSDGMAEYVPRASYYDFSHQHLVDFLDFEMVG